MDTKIYGLPGSDRGKKLLAKAHRTNRQRDAIDRKAGTAAPGDCPIVTHLQTAISALIAGLSLEDWDCVAEGTALLQDAELRVRNTLGREV